MKRLTALATSLALVVGPGVVGGIALRPVAAAPIGFDGNTTYTQDFQSFSTTSGSSSVTLQQMTEVSSLLGGGTVNGWYVYNQSGWTTGFRWFAADSGSSSTGGFRSMYSSTNGNLAFGSQGSSSSVAFYGLVLQNTSGSTINNVSVSFDAVLNRNPSSTVNNSAVSYRTSTTGVTTSATSAGAGTFNNAAGTWTSTTLGFSSPAATTPATPGQPGTQTAFNPMLTIANRSGNLTGLNWGNNDFLYLRISESDESGSDATMGIDNFSFSKLQAQSLTWNVAGGGTWDTTTANFTNGTNAVAFTNGAQTTFNNSAGGTITLAGALAPSTVTVSATAGTYTFSGPTAADKITGATGLTKSGAGTLVLTSANDYAGGTTIAGGVVQISAADQLGSGAITLGGGTLRSGAATALTLTSAITVGSAGGTIDTGAQSLQIGALTSSGLLTKTGAGTLTVAGAITSGAGTGFTVAQGDVVLGPGPTASGVYNVAANSVLTGNLVLSGTQRLNVNDGATISGSGKIQLPTSGALISNLSGNAGGTVAAGIAANSTGQAFTPGSWTGATYTPGSFQTTIGATQGGTLRVDGVISGDTDVDLSNSSAGGGGTGLLLLNAQNTYTGNTTINANTPTVATANVRLGVANALPTTTGLVVGTKTGIGAAVLDLNGFNQQVAYLADGANATVGATKNLTIRNDGASDATLRIGGSVTPGAAFGGVIGTGATNKINVVKSGANTQTLTGANTYTGSTTIEAGTLALAGAGSINSSPTITVAAGATFDVAAVTGGYAVANGQSLGGSGTVVGATTLTAGGRVAPGPGIATFTMGDLTLGAGGAYDLQLFDAAGAAGTGWDLLTAGTVGLPATPAFTINLASASSSGGAAGSTINFNNAVTSSWRILAASALSGVFNAANFSVNTAGFANALGGGTFSVSDTGADGTGLYLVFNPGASLDWIGGDGTWSATGGTNWSGGAWDPAKTAVFNAPAGTVTVDGGGVNADKGLSFNADGYSIGGGALRLGGTTSVANTITVATGSATIASGIDATFGFTKTGPGTLVSTTEIIASDAIVVTGGVLQIGSGGTTGNLTASNVTLADGTSLVFNRSDDAAIYLAGLGGGNGTVRTAGGDLTLMGPIDGGLTVLNTGTATLTAAGAVSGAVKITNSGPGTIALTGPSVTTTGAVTASGGTIRFGDAGLGSGAVAVSNNAALLFDGTTATIANPITIDATGGTVAVAAGDTLSLAGTVTRNGLLTKAGDGTLSLPTLPTTNLSISAGTLAVSATATQTFNADLVDLFDGGKLAFTGAGTRVNLNVSQTGSGAIVFTQPGQSLAQTGSGLNATVANPIELALASGALNIGTTSGNTLVLNGPITGSGNVNLAVGSAGGAGTTVLAAKSTFTGNVTVNSSVSTGVHRLGVDDALPATATVTFGSTAGAIDLAGFDQTIAGLAGTAAGVAGIVNSSSADVSRLTINGAGNTSYAGPIGTVGKTAIELVKNGAGIQTLSGSNGYTGPTQILGGTLALSGNGSIAASRLIDVRSGATFDVTGLTAPFALAAGQTLAGTGAVTGAALLTGGTVSPGVAGSSGGIGSLSMAETTLGNGAFALQMTSATAGAGIGWDLLQTTTLTLPGDGQTFTIDLASVLGDGTAGPATGFDPGVAGSWRIIAASALSGSFVPTRFNVTSSGFANSLAGGSFSISDSGSDGTGLYLTFTPVPEPSTLALLAIGGGLAGWRIRRRKQGAGGGGHSAV